MAEIEPASPQKESPRPYVTITENASVPGKTESNNVASKVRRSVAHCISGPVFKLYVSFFLSAWVSRFLRCNSDRQGDRLWSFALSLVLVTIGCDLRLTATSSFISRSALILLGSVVGSYIDRTARLRAAQVALTVNNISVATSAGALVFVLLYTGDATAWAGPLMTWAAIALCTVSDVAGMATKIIVSRDWIVVICNGDRDMLACG